MGYPKQVYDKAWTVLEGRRQSARERTEARRGEIRRKIPEVAEIERKMAGSAAGIGKVIVNEPHRAEELIRQMGEENLALQARREALLTAAGYPADYLAERFYCPNCKDTGYIGQQRCSCLEELLRREAHARLSSAAPVENCTFSAFDLSYYPDKATDSSGVIPRKRMGEVKQVCRQYALGFSSDAESLLLIGRTGLGKTHLSLAIASEVTGKGFGVVYTPVQKLLDKLEGERFSRDYAAREQFADSARFALECDLLILDDLGTEFATSFTSSALYNIINSRLVERRPTIISTNLELGEIEEKYSQRMVSRLVCGYMVLKFYGKDIRYIKKMQR